MSSDLDHKIQQIVDPKQKVEWVDHPELAMQWQSESIKNLIEEEKLSSAESPLNRKSDSLPVCPKCNFVTSRRDKGGCPYCPTDAVLPPRMEKLPSSADPWLKDRRKMLGLSQLTLAEVLDVSRPTYDRYEKNPDVLPIGHFRRLVVFFNSYEKLVDYSKSLIKGTR
jgi:hypothetical protein